MVRTLRQPLALFRNPNRLVSLSLGQVLAIGLASVGGLIVWILAARMFAPSQLGRASALITLGGLLSTVVAAGLGQYLLAALPETAQRGRLLARVIAAGIAASVVLPTVVGLLLYQSTGLASIILLAIAAVTVTLTTLQDALYLHAGSTKDIAAKAAAITAARLASLALLGPLLVGLGDGAYWMLVLLLAVPQLTVAVAWLALRMPSLLSATTSTSPARPAHAMLGVGYAVALATASVTWGLPAVVTSELDPDRAALFYTSWVLASIVGTVPASLANAVVASAPVITKRHVSVVVGAQLLVSITLLIPLLAGGAWISQLYGASYGGIPSILPAVAIGHLGVGLSMVLIAYVRLAGHPSEVVTASAGVALLASIAPAAVAARLGESQFLAAFVIGAWSAVLMSVLVLMRGLRRQRTSQDD